MDVKKYVSEELMAFIPIYLTDKGDCTLLYTSEGGKTYIDKGLRTVLRSLAKYFLADLKEIRKYYGELLNTKNLVPMPFNECNIFVPMKARKPLGKNDVATGYININSIDRIEAQGKNTLIYLMNDHEITCLSSLGTVNKHIQNGRIVKKLIENAQEHAYAVRENVTFYEELDKPATKEDIAMLRKEILDIRRRLN